MRKSLLLSTILITSCSNARANDYPVAQWANLFGGAAGDQSIAVVVSPTNDVIWLSTAATTAQAPEVYYGEHDISNNSYATNNIELICTSDDGTQKWVVTSTTADFASGQGNVVVDNEGNVIFTAKVRQIDAEHQINLIDAADDCTEIGGLSDRKYYRLMVSKLNKDGKLIWTKLFESSTAPAAQASGNNADFTPDAISATGLAVDGDGNIYVGGNYCTDLTIDDTTLSPTNVDNWTGDSQTACGNMFVVKLDADGKYISSLTGQGNIHGASNIQNLVWNNQCLYIYGYAMGDSSFKFADNTLTPSDVPSAIVGSLNDDLTANWIKCCPCEKVDGKSALQNVSLSVYENNLWLCGQYNLKIIDANDSEKYIAATQGSMREGFIIKFDRTTGDWICAADSRAEFPDIKKITGYMKTVQNETDRVYVYGYVMDATIGVFLREYDAQTLVANIDHSWDIVKGGGVPTAIAAEYSQADNSLYITARGNKAFTLMSDPEITTDVPKNWDILMAKYMMPDKKQSAVVSITEDFDDSQSSEVYDIYGRCVGTGNISELNLAPGIYLKANRKFIVR